MLGAALSNLHGNTVRQVFFSFFRWCDQGSEKVSNSASHTAHEQQIQIQRQVLQSQSPPSSPPSRWPPSWVAVSPRCSPQLSYVRCNHSLSLQHHSLHFNSCLFFLSNCPPSSEITNCHQVSLLSYLSAPLGSVASQSNAGSLETHPSLIQLHKFLLLSHQL